MEVGDKVCIWFDLDNGQRMGVVGIVEYIDEDSGSVRVKYYVLGEFMTRVFTAGAARTHISKFDH